MIYLASGECTTADDDLQLFWGALQHANVTNGFLHLDGACFMGDQLRGQDLMMRDCYVSILVHVRALLDQGLRRFLITGEVQTSEVTKYLGRPCNGLQGPWFMTS